MILDDRAVEAMVRHGEEEYPREACGLLVGRFEAGSAIRRVVEVGRAGNQARGMPARRYDLDPGDHRRIEAEAREEDLEIVGVYHSHPDAAPFPSESDRRHAAEIWGSSESWSHVILEISAGRGGAWKSWILREGTFQEEAVEIVPGARQSLESTRRM